MSTAGALIRAGQVLEFARHMPLAKLVRRLERDVGRSVHDRVPRAWRRHVPVAAPTRAPIPPVPLFEPRRNSVPQSMPDGWRFTFLNRTVEMNGSGVDWNAPAAGAADQLWRMHLHYMEYLEAVDDGAWELLVSDWIEANPEDGRGSWLDSWNSYALSIRVVVWLQELARRGNRLAPAITRRAVASAAEQLLFLEHHLETDLGGNHLIKNIKALLWASVFFSGDDAQRWRATGLRLLSQQLDIQILPDGMHYERSPSYHAQVFADLLECRFALGEDPFDGRLDRALARMAGVTVDLVHPDGGPALFNDAGLSMTYAPRACLSAYERVCGPRPAPRRVFALASAGYYGLRGDDSYLVADCGRIAPDDLPAHGHGDVLSFEWSVAGERFIVDQGVFEYASGDRRRQARTALSHNTLCFDGTDQADFFGAFRCGRRPDVAVIDYAARDDGFTLEGSHDGFSTLAGRPRHVRRFQAGRDELIITDRIDGAPIASARIGFLLHPDVEAACSDRTATLRRKGATVHMTSTAPIEIEPAVWWPDMGVTLATHRLIVRLAPGVTGNSTTLHIVCTERTAPRLGDE